MQIAELANTIKSRMEGNRIGIVGGGQLGRMLTEAAKPLGFEVTVLDPSDPPCPAAQAGAEQIQADLTDEYALNWLASRSSVTTWEIEHINADALINLAQDGQNIQPSPYELLMIQDKLEQKNWLKRLGIPVGDFLSIDSEHEMQTALNQFGSIVIKARRGGYDGRGNLVMDKPDWEAVSQRFGHAQLYAERKLNIQKELSVIVARDTSHRMVLYPTIETIQENGQCHMAVAPARISGKKDQETRQIAQEIVGCFGGCGVFAIEMFLTNKNEVLVNEIAPRVHNSGHLTMEANDTSQFEQHVRAITGLPIGQVDLRSRAAMINILGERDGPVELKGLEKALVNPNTYVHIYGKNPTKVARKMGHITVLASTTSEAIRLATKARREISI